MLPTSFCQGALQLGYELERALSEISGFAACTLQPAAGAQGELCGLLMIRAYLTPKRGNRAQGAHPRQRARHEPASCTLAGYEVVQLKSGPDGVIAPAAVAAR
jgi:glycine dehydrogenase subunit 2